MDEDPPAPSSALFYCLACTYRLWNIPLANSRHLSQLCLLTIPCSPLAYSLRGGRRCQHDKERADLDVLQAPFSTTKAMCVINSILYLLGC